MFVDAVCENVLEGRGLVHADAAEVRVIYSSVSTTRVEVEEMRFSYWLHDAVLPSPVPPLPHQYDVAIGAVLGLTGENSTVSGPRHDAVGVSHQKKGKSCDDHAVPLAPPPPPGCCVVVADGLSIHHVLVDAGVAAAAVEENVILKNFSRPLLLSLFSVVAVMEICVAGVYQEKKKEKVTSFASFFHLSSAQGFESVYDFLASVQFFLSWMNDLFPMTSLVLFLLVYCSPSKATVLVICEMKLTSLILHGLLLEVSLVFSDLLGESHALDCHVSQPVHLIHC